MFHGDIVVIVHMHPQAIPPAMMTMRKHCMGSYEYGTLFGGPQGCHSSAVKDGKSKQKVKKLRYLVSSLMRLYVIRDKVEHSSSQVHLNTEVPVHAFCKPLPNSNS